MLVCTILYLERKKLNKHCSKRNLFDLSLTCFHRKTRGLHSWPKKAQSGSKVEFRVFITKTGSTYLVSTPVCPSTRNGSATKSPAWNQVLLLLPLRASTQTCITPVQHQHLPLLITLSITIYFSLPLNLTTVFLAVVKSWPPIIHLFLCSWSVSPCLCWQWCSLTKNIYSRCTQSHSSDILKWCFVEFLPIINKPIICGYLCPSLLVSLQDR